MNKFTAQVISFTAIGLTLHHAAFAQITNPIQVPSLRQLLIEIIDVVIMLSVPIVVIAVVYAGFLFVTAGGNDQKLIQAKKIIFWSLLGALILFGARVIADVVCNTIQEIDPTLQC